MKTKKQNQKKINLGSRKIFRFGERKDNPPKTGISQGM
jgi:hypothetical protein